MRDGAARNQVVEMFREMPESGPELYPATGLVIHLGGDQGPVAVGKLDAGALGVVAISWHAIEDHRRP